MNLLGMAISLLLVTISLAFCMSGQSKTAALQAESQCLSDGHKQGTEAYNKCIAENTKNIGERAIELQNTARQTNELMQKIKKDIQSNLAQ